MKIFKTILLLFWGIQTFGQKNGSLFTERYLSDSLYITVKNESGIFPSFPRDYTSIVTFKSVGVSVYYFVFAYQSSDSTAFRHAENEYWRVSGCNIIPNKDFDKNFTSFVKDDYYFLLQRCSCRTGENEDCAELAKRINQWIK